MHLLLTSSSTCVLFFLAKRLMFARQPRNNQVDSLKVRGTSTNKEKRAMLCLHRPAALGLPHHAGCATAHPKGHAPAIDLDPGKEISRKTTVTMLTKETKTAFVDCHGIATSEFPGALFHQVSTPQSPSAVRMVSFRHSRSSIAFIKGKSNLLRLRLKRAHKWGASTVHGPK